MEPAVNSSYLLVADEPLSIFATGISTEVMNKHLRLRNHLPISSPATAVITSACLVGNLRGSFGVPREAPRNTRAIISQKKGKLLPAIICSAGPALRIEAYEASLIQGKLLPAIICSAGPTLRIEAYEASLIQGKLLPAIICSAGPTLRIEAYKPSLLQKEVPLKNTSLNGVPVFPR
ncbi:unnamed protein product [Cyprideis torosa]|uniref:Uncharacterized protein n=1 Tax=Cyprideis torosa TaxID=163714 RepID=A0A7R8ZVF6_9CRUS|nr:unnamed protein product [Cyprideis torosa]CAG0903111.1 unnamed protein product [Cyprideis torosa]